MPKKPLSEILRAPADGKLPDDLAPDATPGFPGDDKSDADDLRMDLAPELSDLQEMLFAAGRSDPESARRVLVVLQGMDTSGKGGVIRHAIGLVDPQGVRITGFKAPSEEERRHHFLWRIERALPAPGLIGIFDRSHYEDVLVVRVEQLVPEEEWQARFDEINAFESRLADEGYTILKCFLNVSKSKQLERLAERLEDPHKHWKYNPGDLDARARWDDYQHAYADVLRRCNPDHAPWYAIPSDRKWYRNWAVAELLREKLAGLELAWPEADFDVEAERKRVAKA